MSHQPQLMADPLPPVALDTQLDGKTNGERLKRAGHPDRNGSLFVGPVERPSAQVVIGTWPGWAATRSSHLPMAG